MRRSISIQAEHWLPVRPEKPVIRINWPRVSLAGLLAAIVTIVVPLRFQATREHDAQAVSDGPSAAIEVSSATNAANADFQVSEVPLAATKVSAATKAGLSPTLEFLVEPVAQGTDDRLPLGIFIGGPSEIASAAAIDIIGLPNGWTLSAGWPFAYGWRIPAAWLSAAVILPPRGFSGAIDFAAELRLADNTLVDRRLVRRVSIDPADGNTISLLRVAEGLLAAGDMAAARLVLRRAADAGNARAALLLSETYDQARIDPGLAGEKTTVLLRLAEGLLAARNISAARLALRRAAQAGNARAALLLGETYDGCLIRRLNCSADADPAMARSWYEVAAQFGSADARQRLDRLGRDQAGGDLLSRR